MSTSSITGIHALCGSLIPIVTIIVALRFYARQCQRAEFGPDDWAIIPSYLPFIGMTACALYGINLGVYGRTDPELASEHISYSVETALNVALDCMSTATLGFSRISALFFYRRIFCIPGASPSTLKIAIYITLAIITLWTIAFIILPILQCGTDLSVWGENSATLRAQYCSRATPIFQALTISDLLTETIVIGLPIAKILKLKTSLRRRLGVLFVFVTAFVSYGANTARVVIVSQLLSNQARDRTSTNTTQTFMWILEAGFGLVAVNLPSLWWLRTKVRPESVLAGLRSVISLSSLRGGRKGQVEYDVPEESAGRVLKFDSSTMELRRLSSSVSVDLERLTGESQSWNKGSRE